MKKNLTGIRFGRLVVLSKSQNKRARSFMWFCSCDCGNTADVVTSNLNSGVTKSCGCLSREQSKIRGTKHGLYIHKKELYAYKNMMNRCLNPKTKGFEYYGGRGITVCQRWRQSFMFFFNDLGPAPSKQHSLDRIDFNGNYEPTNCRWATIHVQANNKRNIKNQTGYSGVNFSRSKLKPYRYSFRINKKTICGPLFFTAIEAYEACIKRKKLFC